MTRLQKFILTFLGVIACLLLSQIGWIVYQYYALYWDAPLGPLLILPTSPASLPTPAPASVISASDSTQTPTTSPADANPPISCGETQVMTLLAIGVDSRADSYLYGLADAIRAVRVDFANRRVSILEFPRDMWVEIPEIADNRKGQDHEKLNQAYLYGNPGMGYWDDPSAGPGLLARTLQLNFGFQPDHYIAVNMRTFEAVVNAVGGIDVYLPEAVDGRTADDTRETLYFPHGMNHLNGTEALQLARIRIEGTFQRADSQDRVLCALRDKLTSPSVLPRVPEIVQSFLDNVQTDLSPEQISHLACLGTQISPDAILFAGFPQELFTVTRIYDPVFKKRLSVLDVDFNVLRQYVSMFQSGVWPAPGAVAAGESGNSTPFCPPPGQ